MPPRHLHFIELPESRTASALLANLRREARALLAADRIPPRPEYPPVLPGDASDADRLAHREKCDRITTAWERACGEMVVRAMRFLGTSWAPQYAELAVAVVKWAQAVLVELAAADETVVALEQQLVQQHRELVDLQARLQGQVDALRAGLDRQLALTQTAEVRATGAEAQVQALLLEVQSLRATADAWRTAAEASAAAARSAENSLDLLRSALRIPAPAQEGGITVPGRRQ